MMQKPAPFRTGVRGEALLEQIHSWGLSNLEIFDDMEKPEKLMIKKVMN
jgi:hypothetical protein